MLLICTSDECCSSLEPSDFVWIYLDALSFVIVWSVTTRAWTIMLWSMWSLEFPSTCVLNLLAKCLHFEVTLQLKLKHKSVSLLYIIHVTIDMWPVTGKGTIWNFAEFLPCVNTVERLIKDPPRKGHSMLDLYTKDTAQGPKNYHSL